MAMLQIRNPTKPFKRIIQKIQNPSLDINGAKPYSKLPNTPHASQSISLPATAVFKRIQFYKTIGKHKRTSAKAE